MWGKAKMGGNDCFEVGLVLNMISTTRVPTGFYNKGGPSTPSFSFFRLFFFDKFSFFRLRSLGFNLKKFSFIWALFDLASPNYDLMCHPKSCNLLCGQKFKEKMELGEHIQLHINNLYLFENSSKKNLYLFESNLTVFSLREWKVIIVGTFFSWCNFDLLLRNCLMFEFPFQM